MIYSQRMVLRFSQTLLSRINNSKTLEGYVFNNHCKVVNRQVSNQQGNIKPIRMAFTAFASDGKEKVPIVVMHGLFGSKTNWYSICKAFVRETGKTVYAVDARNHGDSPHSEEHTYFHLSEDIKLFMTENNIDKADLIGHSMGGRAVMAFALLNPKKVNTLTVVDMSPIGTSSGMGGMSMIFDTMDSVKKHMSGESLSGVRKVIETKLSSTLKSKALSNFLSMNVGEKLKGTFNWKINLDTLKKAYDPHISAFPITEGTFEGPTLFVYGEKSDFFNLDDADEIKKLFPKATFVEIAGAGHWLHAEQPKKFIEVTSHFIKSH